MALRLEKELSFFEIYQSIGRPISSEQRERAALQLHREEDRIAGMRREQMESNIQRVIAPEIKPQLEKVKSDMKSDLEIVETQTDPEDIDVLYKSQACEGRLCPYSKLI